MEARTHGADAPRIPAPAVSDAELEAMIRASADLGMAAVVAAHSERDVDRALGAGSEIVCVDSRDPDSGELDEGLVLRLTRRIGDDRPVVVGSAIARRDE